MGFWFTFFLFVGTTVLSAILQKKPKDATPSSAGDFQVPTAQEGRPISYVAGTCKVSGPNVIWWGDLKVNPIKKSSGGFLGIGAKKVTVGYKYSLGMDMALCFGPIDALVEIRVGDKVCPFSSAVVGVPENYLQLTIDQTGLFGGDEKEGGIQGSVAFYRGLSTQQSDSYLTSKFGHTAPAYPGLCHAVLQGVYVGTSSYIKEWAFVVRRCPAPAGMTAGKANINGDANPSYIILDLMQDTNFGLGIPQARFDLASFQAAADTLYTEGFGMSLLLDSDTTADQALSEVCRTVDAVIYTDPSTGKWTMKLVRADYVVGNLQEITQAELQEEPEFSRASWSDTINEVKIEYLDRAANFNQRVVQAQETANYAIQGDQSTETFTFKGISTADLALKIAMRELKTHSYPLAQFRLVLNRAGWSLRPGAAFRLSWNPPTGPAWTDMVLRVTNIRYGALDQGKIEVDAVEDVFSVASTAYSNPGGTGWTDPMADPAGASAQVLVEAPYWLVGEARYAMAMAARGDTTSYAAEVWVRENSVYFKGNDLTNMTPSGLLASSYGAISAAVDSVGFTIAAGGRDMDRMVAESTDAAGRVRGANLAWFSDTGEIGSWTTCTDNGDGTYTFSGVQRGVMDTVPADHPAGTRVWFMSEGACTTKETPYASDQTVTAKMLPKNARGTFPIGSASSVALTTASRAFAPNPPGNVKVNALGHAAWPSTILGDAAYTWEHRNRVTQGQGLDLVSQDGTALGQTLEGDLTVEVLVGGTVKSTLTAQTGTSRTYTAAQRATDDTDGTKAVQLRITPKNGSLTGTVRTTPGVVMTGFGMTFGNYFGGIQA